MAKRHESSDIEKAVKTWCLTDPGLHEVANNLAEQEVYERS